MYYYLKLTAFFKGKMRFYVVKDKLVLLSIENNRNVVYTIDIVIQY